MIISTDTHERGDITYLICDVVADQIDADICELPPLYETIDPDALDTFLRYPNSEGTHPKRSVEFSYCDYRVRVDSNGQLQLDPETESESPKLSD